MKPPERKDVRHRITPSYVPRQVEKAPPCQMGCPNGTDIRRWIGVVAQRGKNGESDAAAFDQAWRIITDVNPFPSVLGRICPHPCESGCNRGSFDDALSIHSMERFLGDRAIDRGLQLRRKSDRRYPERIGVVGAGPSGLSFAYQMVRRGYPVTIYESNEQLGGMLRYGIPSYRLPKPVLDAEIARIVKLGVEVRAPVRIGRDISLEELRSRHAAVYVALGAQRGRELGIPGEAGPGVWSGTEFLQAVSCGESMDLGQTTLVIGGGNTAIDAARTCRRLGSKISIAYRRTREEMPAAKDELEDAVEEGVEFRSLLQVVRLERDRDDRLVAAVTRRMRLGDLDETGRGSPVPIPGSEELVPVDSVIVAVSQTPDLEGLDGLDFRGGCIVAGNGSLSTTPVLAGGDVVGLGIAGNAIVQGRRAAESLHAQLRGLPPREQTSGARIATPGSVKFDSRSTTPRVVARKLDVRERLEVDHSEVVDGITAKEFLGEVERCASCGSCFGCEQCAMFCTAGCFEKLATTSPGSHFTLDLDNCRECGKCVEVCPCGFLDAES